MEATHFISVIKGYEGKLFNMPCQKMYFLQYTLNGIDYGYAETIAVWRIKPTDVPIGIRLANRIGGGTTFCSPEMYEFINQECLDGDLKPMWEAKTYYIK